MVTLYDSGVYLLNGKTLVPEKEAQGQVNVTKEDAKKSTIAYGILQSHNVSDDPDNLKIRFDAITSHDLTYVGIIQTARASGLDKFPLPYVLTCCHNSLCAVGGTINEDDHLFGLTACKKFGGIYLPPHLGVIHQYMREAVAGGGKMILGSDSHTRYGALGTMAVGEGGGELVKQILEQTWDSKYPEVVCVYLDGKPRPGIGPQDIAIAMHVVPCLCHDEQIFSLAKTIAECSLEYITDHSLITVAGCTVEHTITGFDSAVNSLRYLISCKTVRTEGSHTDARYFLSVI